MYLDTLKDLENRRRVYKHVNIKHMGHYKLLNLKKSARNQIPT